MRWLAIAALALLAACVHDRAPRGGETITYATTRCLGACPVYSIQLGPDGQGIFTGEQFTAASGDHRFRATPDQVRAFRALLQPYRPKGERLIEPGRAGCKDAPTDMPSIDVRWTVAIGRPAHLRFYGGCARENRKLADALRSAPGALPVAELIGQR